MAPPSTRATSVFQRFISSMKDMLDGSANLGKTWEGLQASEAFDKGELKSIPLEGKRVRVAFRNLCPFPLMLCWVSNDSQLHHFYKLAPQDGDAFPKASMVTLGDHIENTVTGDAFCVVCLPEDEIEQAQKNRKIPDSASICAGYMPNDYKSKKGAKDPVYLVSICYEDEEQSQEEVICCKPTFLRKRPRPTLDIAIPPFSKPKPAAFFLRQAVAKIDPNPFDTTNKFYEQKTLGGWPVYLEPNWHGGDKSIEERLGRDLEAAAKILPEHAVEYLREKCPIWVNSSIKFGPKVCPVTAVACCYHPDEEWLVENGLHAEKHLCVEINDGPGYKKDVDLWGVGGLMIHELSHAYHHRLVQDGYKNKEIEECFNAAMKEGLYDMVKVHGKQGPEAKAYACTNCMEYWAELSTAFLGGTSEEVEFNKWYPYNRQQIKEHDPRAYELLSRLWKVEET